MNYHTPTRKPTGWSSDASGRRRRADDDPATPLDRLLAADVFSNKQSQELIAYRSTLNPAEIARNIQTIQDRLTGHARDRTLDLGAPLTKPLPDTPTGIRLRPSA
ncbi:transposase [Brachybacterium sp. YJGR34]|uniref:transposase n=1 Tax=Brachybacterium sp. YJGR34 TaxID=2059911 RepID=UPI0018E62393|nr:transposase [Brachybacterium sp. YJGR34]